MTQPLAPSAVGLLVLARLLPAGDKGEAREKLAKDLGPLVDHRWEGAAWADRLGRALVDLESAGRIARQKKGKVERLALTADGHRVALDALGLKSLPPKMTWAKIKSPYLLGHALGQAVATPARAKYLAGEPGLKAELLRARYGLDLGVQPTAKQAADALAGKLLGLGPGLPFNKDQILAALLRREGIEVRAGQKLNPATIQEAVLRRELGDRDAKNPADALAARSVSARRKGKAELAEATLRAWVDRAELTPEVENPAAPDLAEFARRVVDAASASPAGWFGDGKVFIAHVWRALRNDQAFSGLDEDAFKSRLVEAHRVRLLELGRGDLVEAMDPADVRESATPYLNAVYHFVRAGGHAR